VYHDKNEAIRTLSVPRHKDFGLCELDVAEVLRVTGGRVWVEGRTPGKRSSHGSIHECVEPEIWAALASVAKVIVTPGKARR
jgi:hypothetical protein